MSASIMGRAPRPLILWRTDRGRDSAGQAWSALPVLRDRRAMASPSRQTRRLSGVGVGSLVLHGAVLLCLLPHGAALSPGVLPRPQHTVEMEFIEHAPSIKGGPPPETTVARTPDHATAAPAPATAPPAAASLSPSDLALAQPPRPAAPPAAAAPHWQTSMLDDPGTADHAEDAYSVRASDGIRPARPNAAYRNLPPRYPAEASRQGLRGEVDMLVHVTPDGRAGQVDVVSGSGAPVLDHEAVRALSRWHFEPQMSGGVAVPSEFRIAVHFDGEAR